MVTDPTISAVGQVPDDILDPFRTHPAEMGTAQIGYTRWYSRDTSFSARVNSVLFQDKWVRVPAEAAPDIGSMLTVSVISGEEPIHGVLALDEQSTGFSEAARSQLARLSRDLGAVTDAFGSASARWLAGEIEPVVSSFADLVDLTAMREVMRRVFQARAEAVVEETGQSQDDEYPEWEWIQRNRTLLEERYTGLWIAVVGRQLVAVADSPADLLEQTEGFERPFMYHVPAESEPAVVASG